MSEKPKKDRALIRSIADEVKKVAYLGAAGPYLIMGDTTKTAVGAATLITIAIAWFVICQVVAHVLLSLAVKMENEDE